MSGRGGEEIFESTSSDSWAVSSVSGPISRASTGTHDQRLKNQGDELHTNPTLAPREAIEIFQNKLFVDSSSSSSRLSSQQPWQNTTETPRERYARIQKELTELQTEANLLAQEKPSDASVWTVLGKETGKLLETCSTLKDHKGFSIYETRKSSAVISQRLSDISAGLVKDEKRASNINVNVNADGNGNANEDMNDDAMQKKALVLEQKLFTLELLLGCASNNYASSSFIDFDSIIGSNGIGSGNTNSSSSSSGSGLSHSNSRNLSSSTPVSGLASSNSNAVGGVSQVDVAGLGPGRAYPLLPLIDTIKRTENRLSNLDLSSDSLDALQGKSMALKAELDAVLKAKTASLSSSSSSSSLSSSSLSSSSSSSSLSSSSAACDASIKKFEDFSHKVSQIENAAIDLLPLLTRLKAIDELRRNSLDIPSRVSAAESSIQSLQSELRENDTNLKKLKESLSKQIDTMNHSISKMNAKFQTAS